MTRDSELRDGAVRVVRTLRRRGFDAWFVGGCVRDRLLGRPIKEYDIATSARPDDVVRVFPRTIGVGAQFGVIVVLEREGQYEVATFRAEAAYTDGRRPDQIRFVSAREDVLRRDFTVNGLLEDPETGEIADFIDGRQDLDAGILRAIGDPSARFEEDHLRMLRAVRFAATLGFEVEPETLAAITQHAKKVSGVAMERVQVELRRAFHEGDPGRALGLLASTGLLDVTLPEHGDPAVSAAAFQVLGKCPLALALAVLLEGRTEDAGRAVAERLRLSRDDRDRLCYLLGGASRFPLEPRALAQELRFVREPGFVDLANVEGALRSARGLDAGPVEQRRQLLRDTPPERLNPPRFVDGNTLRAAGMAPGPHFKRILDAVEDAQLEGRVTTEAEALALATVLSTTMM